MTADWSPKFSRIFGPPSDRKSRQKLTSLRYTSFHIRAFLLVTRRPICLAGSGVTPSELRCRSGRILRHHCRLSIRRKHSPAARCHQNFRFWPVALIVGCQTTFRSLRALEFKGRYFAFRGLPASVVSKKKRLWAGSNRTFNRAAYL